MAESPSSLACTAAGASGNTPDVANHSMTQIVNHPGVPIHLFTRHVLERHANDNEGFVRAFEHIESLAAASPSRSSPTAAKENLASLLPHNVEKNRYKNVLACEYRVLLNIDSTQYAKRTFKYKNLLMELCRVKEHSI